LKRAEQRVQRPSAGRVIMSFSTTAMPAHPMERSDGTDGQRRHLRAITRLSQPLVCPTARPIPEGLPPLPHVPWQRRHVIPRASLQQASRPGLVHPPRLEAECHPAHCHWPRRSSTQANSLCRTAGTDSPPTMPRSPLSLSRPGQQPSNRCSDGGGTIGKVLVWGTGTPSRTPAASPSLMDLLPILA
jgi:hypothetical protein